MSANVTIHNSTSYTRKTQVQKKNKSKYSWRPDREIYVNHARVLRGFHFYWGRSCRAKMSSVDHGYVPSPAALETSQAQTRFVFARCIPSLVIGACATRSSLYSLTTVSPPPFSFLIPFFAQARTMPSPHLR